MPSKDAGTTAFSEAAPQPNNMRLFEMAKGKAEEESISLSAAMASTRRDYPELAAEADFEVTGRRPEAAPSAGLGHTATGQAGGAVPNPSELLVTLAERVCRERHVFYTEAIVLVAREHPDLASAARRQVLGIKDP